MKAMNAVEVSVPGKIMLAGEYAVLHGSSTLSATIGATLRAKILPTDKNSGWNIDSNLWNETVHLKAEDDIDSPSPLTESVKLGRNTFQTFNGNLSITSELDCTYGVGSSSALRLAVLFAMREYSQFKETVSDLEIGQLVVDLQKKNQPMASGYDVATQMIGGLIKLDFSSPLSKSTNTWYKNSETFNDHKFDNMKSIVHVYVGGSGAPTGGTMQRTLQWLEENKLINQVIETSNNLVEQFICCFRDLTQQNVISLFQAIKKNRALFESCADFPKNIAKQLLELDGCDQTWSFKTTGAGGEDALLLIGKKEDLYQADSLLKSINWLPIPYKFSTQNIQIKSLHP
jgi:mevalonate kinase